MADRFAAEYYFDAVAARFTAEGTAATNVFGWRSVQQHPDSNRVSWVPGDPSGKMGELVGAKQPGRNPRSIATVRELFTVYIDAVDTSDLENERVQYHAARLLFDAWFRALYLAGHGNIAVRSVDWNGDALVRRYGCTLRVTVSIDGMVPDTAAALAPVDTSAIVDLTVQDNTETEIIP